MRGLLDFASFMPARGFSLEAGLKVLTSFACFAGPCFCPFEGKTSQGACSVLSYLNQHFDWYCENWKTGSTSPCPPPSCGSLPLASCTACDPSSSWSYLAITHYYDTVPGLHLNFLVIFLEIAMRSSSHLCSTMHKTHRLQTASSLYCYSRWSFLLYSRPPAGCWRCRLLCFAQHYSWTASLPNLFAFFAFINYNCSILSRTIQLSFFEIFLRFK